MVITDATQTGINLGVEEAGAMNDWKLPTCAPQTGLACLVWPGAHFKLLVKSLFFGIFSFPFALFNATFRTVNC